MPTKQEIPTKPPPGEAWWGFYFFVSGLFMSSLPSFQYPAAA